MSVVPSPHPENFSSEELTRLISFYLAEFRKVHLKHEEFLNQKFTFIKAVQRDHITTGASQTCIDSVATLDRVLMGLNQNEWSSKIDVDVVSVCLQNINELNRLLRGLVQLYAQTRDKFGFDASGADKAVVDLKYYMNPQSSVLRLAQMRQLHLNDREKDQVGGLFNLIPFLLHTSGEVTAALGQFGHQLHQQELEQQMREQQQQKPPTPVVQSPAPLQTSDADSQAMAQDIFAASRQYSDAGTQLTASDWRKMQLQEKHRNYVYGLGHFPPFATNN